MPIALRGATLTAATSPRGIYVWTKTKENALCELRNEISDTKLAEAIQKNDIDALSPPKDRWVSEDFQDVECDPHSTLCGVAWDDSSQSIFYQDDQNNILEWRRLAGQKWQTNSVGQLSCLKGTNIAVVHSAHGHRAMLFFQDDKNNVCFSRGEFRKWGPAEVVAPAAKLTGIGATSWDGKPELEQVALYFQGERGSINEYRGSFADGLHLHHQFEVRELPKKHLVGDITAISWKSSETTHIRLYFQDVKNQIIEYTNEGDSGWRRGSLTQECFPNADIIAVPRVAGPDNRSYCVNVFWVGLDQKVAQSVYLAQTKWSKASAITDDSSVGMFVGSNEGKSFSGDDDEVDNKRVRTVNIRLFDEDNNISSLWLDFTDGQSSEVYGVKTGTLKQFVLNEGEEITHVWAPAPGPDEPINGLRFGTSHGRRSEWFGQDYAKYVKQWSQDGHPLVGFWGATDREKSHIIGLGPVFATRESNLDLRVVSELASRQPELTRRRQAIVEEVLNIQHATNSFKDETDRVRTQEASATIRQLAVLAHTIEYYSDLSRASQKARLGPYQQRQADVARERSSCDKTAHALFVDIQTVLAKCAEVRRQGDQLRFRLDQATKDFNLVLDDFRFRYIKENVNEIRTVLQWEERHAYDEWQDCHRFFDNSKKPEDVQRVKKALKKKTDLTNKIKTLTAFHAELERFHVETLRNLAYLRGLVDGATAALEAFAGLSKYDAYNPSRIDWAPKRFASELYEVSRIVFAQSQLKEQFASETSSPDELVDTLRGIIGTTVSN